MKDFVKVVAVNETGRAAKKFNGRLLAEGALRAKNCNALWRL
jgi:uncharacterized lipoprotein YajG